MILCYNQKIPVSVLVWHDYNTSFSHFRSYEILIHFIYPVAFSICYDERPAPED